MGTMVMARISTVQVRLGLRVVQLCGAAGARQPSRGKTRVTVSNAIHSQHQLTAVEVLFVCLWANLHAHVHVHRRPGSAGHDAAHRSSQDRAHARPEGRA